MPKATLRVELIAHTPNPEKICALAARTCYSGLEYEDLSALVNEKDQSAFLRRVMASGHLSVPKTISNAPGEIASSASRNTI